MLGEDKLPILGDDGQPLLYQVVAVYRGRDRVSLVTSYGEYIGLYPVRDIEVVSRKPLFSKDSYEEGFIIVWIDGEDVYEGEIETLYDSYAKVINVKKLMPVNHASNVSYWKISEGRKSIIESTSEDDDSNIGNDLNKRRD